MGQYPEGQRLMGSDGKVYVVRNGVPVTEGPSPLVQNPMFPGQLQGQGLNNQGQVLQNVRTQQQIQSQPLQNENTAVNIAQGRKSIENTDFGNANTLRQSFNALPEVKNYSEALAALGGAMKAPDNAQGDLSVIYAFAKAMDPGSVVREGEMDMANQTASLVSRIQQQYGMIGNGKRLPPEVRTGLIEAARQKVAGMRPLYDQQRARFSELAGQAHARPEDVVGAPLYDAIRPAEEDYIRAHGGTPRDPNAITPDIQTDIAKGQFRNEYDPQLSAQIDGLIRRGAPYAQAAAVAKQAGYPAPDQGEYSRAVAYARKNPGYRGALAEANKPVQNSALQQLMGSPAGAFASGAAKAATLGFGDELAASVMPGDYAANRDDIAARQAMLAGENPGADLLGQMAGGAVTGLGINALASKIPGASGALIGGRFPSLLNRGAVASDVGYGAGYGAGSDNDNRLRGLGIGAGLGFGGGIAARGVVNGAASAISPTGGVMRPLYDMGVRPSIGQRMGGMFNTAEEKMQSLPIVGSAIRGTRDRARDQFQIGLFNDALEQIGRKLPDGMNVGHEPHAFAQNAFNQAYDKAKSGMTAKLDDGLMSDLTGVVTDVGTLTPDSQRIFRKIWDDSVKRRAVGGELSGDGYKSATSEIEKKVKAIRNSKTGDGELADALQGAADALKASAMRNSDMRSAMAMNAADRGYARMVRIEEASRKAGGEPAEFSPSQYNTAVKTASGGTRNREYLRGDALNADIAALGTRLGDKVSNSGTVDRMLPFAIASGMGYMEPMSAAALSAYGALNAPGIRGITTGLMAPRTNPFLKATGEELRQRARLAGMFGAPLALDYYGN